MKQNHWLKRPKITWPTFFTNLVWFWTDLERMNVGAFFVLHDPFQFSKNSPAIFIVSDFYDCHFFGGRLPSQSLSFDRLSMSEWERLRLCDPICIPYCRSSGFNKRHTASQYRYDLHSTPLFSIWIKEQRHTQLIQWSVNIQIINQSTDPIYISIITNVWIRQSIRFRFGQWIHTL